MNEITATNYSESAVALMETRNQGFSVALEKTKHMGEEFEAEPRRWGAWRAYFASIGYRNMVRFMDYRGADNKPITVPTLWPNEFDSRATVQGDNEAGQRFMRGYRPPRQDYADAVRRAATVAAYRAGFKVVSNTAEDACPGF